MGDAGSEGHALGEHDVADTAVAAVDVGVGDVLVEEVVKRHGELEDGLVVVGEGVGDGEVETEAVGEPVLPGSFNSAETADSLIVEDTGFDGGVFASEEDTGTRLEVEAAQMVIVGFEDNLLTLEVGTGIESDKRGRP